MPKEALRTPVTGRMFGTARKVPRNVAEVHGSGRHNTADQRRRSTPQINTVNVKRPDVPKPSSGPGQFIRGAKTAAVIKKILLAKNLQTESISSLTARASCTVD